MQGIKISGTGRGFPERVLTNEAVAGLCGTVSPDWIETNLGISERRIAACDELTSDLAVRSAQEALNSAGYDKDAIELLIVATATPDQAAPATATIVAEKLGMHCTIAFDVSAVCSGFLFGLVTASQFIRTGEVKRALIVGADIFSRITNWGARDAGFFGDGAGAVVLEASDSDQLLPNDLRVFGGVTHFHVPPNKRAFCMDAKKVAQSAGDHLPIAVKQTLKQAGLSPDDIDLVVPHQPSIRLLQRVSESIGISWEKFHLSMDRFANTAGATIPITLHDARIKNRIHDGTRILFMSAGAGMSVGAAVYQWH